MTKIMIEVNVNDENSIKDAINILGVLLNQQSPDSIPEVQVIRPEVIQTGADMLDMSDLGGEIMVEEPEGDDLDMLIGGAEEPIVPSIEDIKAAFGVAVKSKGKDDTATFVKKVLAKLGAGTIKEVADDKRQSFIDVLGKFANK